MAFEKEQREALRLLQGIENGSLQAAETALLIDQSDPALVYLVFTWLRNHYRGDHPAAEGVVGRLVELTGSRSIKAKIDEGKSDGVVAWFEEEHSYRNFSASEFIALVVEKLEG
jgi:hypothetical protein